MSEVKQEGDFKIKKRKTPKKLVGKDEVLKVDLSQPAKEEQDITKVVINEESDNAIQEQSTDASNDTVGQSEDSSNSQEVVEKVQDTATEKSDGVLQEITEEEQVQAEELREQVAQAVTEQEVGINLPENIQKVVDFMNDTGGTLQDYVRLNADYSNIDNGALLREYYKNTKPYLEGEDINLLLEDFSYDEELDEERDVRKKKIAYKEEIAKAKNFLEGLKSKYYDEIKLRPGVTQEQKKAVDFFNRYQEEVKANQATRDNFVSKTKQYFTDDFKGFDFSVGDKRFRYGVKDPSSVMNAQSDLKDVVGKFLDDKGNVKNYSQYHKAIFAASNADTIAHHFYEQGKADAVRNITAKSNNISNDIRQSAPNSVFVNGIKVKAINGVSSSKLKIKRKN